MTRGDRRDHGLLIASGTHTDEVAWAIRESLDQIDVDPPLHPATCMWWLGLVGAVVTVAAHVQVMPDPSSTPPSVHEALESVFWLLAPWRRTCSARHSCTGWSPQDSVPSRTSYGRRSCSVHAWWPYLLGPSWSLRFHHRVACHGCLEIVPPSMQARYL